MDSLKKAFGWAVLGVGLIATWQFYASPALITATQFYVSAGLCAALVIGGGWLSGAGSSSAPAPAPA